MIPQLSTNTTVEGTQARSILVTGGTGFVGRHVVKHLLDSNFRIVLLTRARERCSILPDSRIAEIRTTADLFSETLEGLTNLVSGCSTLIHCAWCTDRSDYQTSHLNANCLEGTIRLAQAFSSSGGIHFVGLGTCAEYDYSDGTVTLSTPLRPTSLYAACKASAFFVLENLFAQRGVNFTWCRLFYLFGDGERPDRLIPTVRRHLEEGTPVPLTDGTQIRDFLDVREAARLISEVAMACHNGPVNICSETGISVRALVESIADEYGRRDLLKFGARSMNRYDPPCIIGKRASNL